MHSFFYEPYQEMLYCALNKHLFAKMLDLGFLAIFCGALTLFGVKMNPNLTKVVPDPEIQYSFRVENSD